jgi:hypothetical protein
MKIVLSGYPTGYKEREARRPLPLQVPAEEGDDPVGRVVLNLIGTGGPSEACGHRMPITRRDDLDS